MAKQIAEEIFYVLSGTIAIFVLLEIVWPGVVLAYININWVLIFWLVNVIVILIINKDKNANK
jgi:hypothetical protein